MAGGYTVSVSFRYRAYELRLGLRLFLYRQVLGSRFYEARDRQFLAVLAKVVLSIAGRERSNVHRLRAGLVVPTYVRVGPGRVSFTAVLYVFFVFPNFRGFVERCHLFYSKDPSLGRYETINPTVLLRPIRRFYALRFRYSFYGYGVDLLCFSHYRLSTRVYYYLQVRNGRGGPLRQLVRTVSGARVQRLAQRLLDGVVLRRTLRVRATGPHVLGYGPYQFIASRGVFVFVWGVVSSVFCPRGGLSFS